MPRPLRIEYAGAVYHGVNGGDRREAIFWDGPEPLGAAEEKAKRIVEEKLTRLRWQKASPTQDG
jgi:hypothetical protein